MLTAADSITNGTPCPSDPNNPSIALSVDNGVSLDCGGREIVGDADNASIGILVLNDTQLFNCSIRNFRVGIAALNPANHQNVKNVSIHDNNVSDANVTREVLSGAIGIYALIENSSIANNNVWNYSTNTSYGAYGIVVQNAFNNSVYGNNVSNISSWHPTSSNANGIAVMGSEANASKNNVSYNRVSNVFANGTQANAFAFFFQSNAGLALNDNTAEYNEIYNTSIGESASSGSAGGIIFYSSAIGYNNKAWHNNASKISCPSSIQCIGFASSANASTEFYSNDANDVSGAAFSHAANVQANFSSNKASNAVDCFATNSGAGNATLWNNSFFNCSRYGVLLNQSSYNNLTNNTVYNASWTGILLENASFNNVSFNNVSSNALNTGELDYKALWNPLLNESTGTAYNDSVYYLAPPNLLRQASRPNGGFLINELGYNGTQDLAAVTFTNNSDNTNNTAYFNNSAVTSCADFQAWMLANYSSSVTCTYYNAKAYAAESNKQCYHRDNGLRFTEDSTNFPDSCPTDPYGGISVWDGSSNNSVEYNFFNGNDHNTITVGATLSASSDNNSIKYNNMTYSLYNGVSLTGESNKIESNQFLGCSNIGIIASGHTNTVKNNSLYGVDTGLSLLEIRAENNSVQACDTGVLFYHSSGAEAFNNTIADCRNGIRIAAGFLRANATNNSAYYNVIKNCSAAAISFEHAGVFTESYSVNNSFYYNNLSDSFYGIAISDGVDVSQNNYFVGNNVNNCTTGILLKGHYKNNEFLYNNVTSSSDWAIKVLSTNKNDFLGNVFDSNGNGVYLKNLTELNFTANKVANCLGTPSYGISLSPLEYESAPYYPIVHDWATGRNALVTEDDFLLPPQNVNGTQNFSLAFVNISDGTNLTMYFEYSQTINNCADVNALCNGACYCKEFHAVAFIEQGYGNDYAWNSTITSSHPVVPGFTSPPFLRVQPSAGITLIDSSGALIEANNVTNCSPTNIAFKNSSNNLLANNSLSQPNYAMQTDVALQINSTNNTFLNTTFNKTSANFSDAWNNLTVKWFLDVQVLNYSLAPIENANVTIEDAFHNVIANQELTNAQGRIGYRAVTEYEQNGSQVYGVNATMYSPFNFTAAPPTGTTYSYNHSVHEVSFSHTYQILLLSSTPDLAVTAITPNPNKRVFLSGENVSFDVTVFNGCRDPLSTTLTVTANNSGAEFHCSTGVLLPLTSKTIKCGYSTMNGSTVNVTASLPVVPEEIQTSNNAKSILLFVQSTSVSLSLPDSSPLAVVLAALAAALLLARNHENKKRKN